jgi:hypothetical protein
MKLLKGMLIVVFALSLFSSCNVAYDYECTKVVWLENFSIWQERYAILPTKETADQWCEIQDSDVRAIVSCDCVKIYE